MVKKLLELYMKKNYILESVRRVCKQKSEINNYIKNRLKIQL